MGRFNIYILTNTVALFLCMVGTVYCMHAKLVFSCLLCSVLCLLVIINIYRLQNRQTKMIKKAIECLKSKDTSSIITPPFKDREISELAENLTYIIKDLKNSAMEDETKYQYYKNLMNSVDTAVISTYKDGRIIWMNKSAKSILGPEVFKLPEDIQNALNNKEKIVHRKKQESTLDLSVSYTQITVHGKEQFIISMNNIHSALEKNEMEAWQKLIRVLTHEIMNSITPIISLSDTLKERSTEFPINENAQRNISQGLGIINRRCKGLVEFVENYRKLTRISTPVKSEIIISDFFKDIEGLTATDYIHFSLENKNMTLTADRAQMEQVFLNIIKNAIEACKKTAGPQIVVSAVNYKNDSIKFSITDNGEGIMPEVKERIFVPFFTTKPNGSGIGLSLCKQIITLHDGYINVESKVGYGTTFTIILAKS
ncbi:sensor histidine kinase [Bacteroides caecigallinarum]|uniref:sensor histidine kinase n=1 Tax=Bacteroides caecigallinarum TaxID=1411144 RepID=UPI001F2C8B14|nr:ATP-binding protein [Bacteroides caecigallinarum]MCF2550486.1 GHKL domain-containing protein [Bacteroides caecigallinarum]